MSTLGKHWKIKDTSKMRGKHFGREFKKGVIPWNKNTKGIIKHNEDWRRLMSEKFKGRKITWGSKISSSLKGKRHSLTSKLKMSQAKKGKYAGSKHWNWKGGITDKEVRAGRKKSKTCEACGSIERICFDHDHKTGKFRGWICFRCNAALGMVSDNPEHLRKLINYLIKFI